MELDPEKRLWLPSRRSFFFLGAAAGVGALLPNAPVRMSATEAAIRMNQALIYQKEMLVITEAEIVEWLRFVMEFHSKEGYRYARPSRGLVA